MYLSKEMLDSQRRSAQEDRDWRAREAEKVEARHQADSRKASNRFWLGFVFAVVVTLMGQATSAYIARTWPTTPQPDSPVASTPSK